MCLWRSKIARLLGGRFLGGPHMLQNSASGGGFFGAARGNLYSALEAIFAAPSFSAHF
jgi:hypothetical protein